MKTSCRSFLRGLLTLALPLLCLAARAAAEEPGAPFAGRWDGVILVSPSELEIPFALDVPPAPGGAAAAGARISFPTQDVLAQPMDRFEVEGHTVRFVFHDEHDVSSFQGQLQGDGTIEGTLTEGENVFPWSLERTGASGSSPKRPRPALHDLAASAGELKEQFNRDAGKVRLLLILSPSCPTCRDSARIVQKYVLDTIADPRVKVYVVWEPVQSKDSRSLAETVTSYLPDARATHFWEAGRAVGTSFKGDLGIKSFPAWDVFLVFSPESRWGAAPPAPAFFMHNLLGEPELPKEKHLNGVRLAEEIRRQLQGAAGAKAAGR